MPTLQSSHLLKSVLERGKPFDKIGQSLSKSEFQYSRVGCVKSMCLSYLSIANQFFGPVRRFQVSRKDSSLLDVEQHSNRHEEDYCFIVFRERPVLGKHYISSPSTLTLYVMQVQSFCVFRDTSMKIHGI